MVLSLVCVIYSIYSVYKSKSLCKNTHTPEESCKEHEAETVDGSRTIPEEACVAAEVDGPSSDSRTTSVAAVEVSDSSFWTVGAPAPKYFRSAPEFTIKII